IALGSILACAFMLANIRSYEYMSSTGGRHEVHRYCNRQGGVTMERRVFLAGAAALAASAASGGEALAQTSDARARIVIAGAGAAGLALAARLRRQMPNATVILIDAKKEHHFQPGFTLVAAGL